MDYNSFYGVTEQVLEEVSKFSYIFKDQDELGNERETLITFKDEKGEPKIKACMAFLGFDPNYPITVVLREEKEVKDRIPSVRVRHPLMNRATHNTKVYASRMRDDYFPPEEFHEVLRNIYIGDGLVHVAAFDQFDDIQDIGDYE